MSIKRQALTGALLLFGGLLLVTYGGMSKSNARIQYQRDLDRGRPEPRVPENGAANVILVIGALVSVCGPFLLVSAVKGMTREIGEAQSRAETRLRMEAAVKRDPKPKP